MRSVARSGHVIWRIERDEHDVLRIVDRRNTDKRDDLVLDRIAVFIKHVDFFGRTGLAAHAVARGLGRTRRAVGDDVLHHLAHGLRRFLADDLPQNRALVGLHDAAVAVQHLTDHVWL